MTSPQYGIRNRNCSRPLFTGRKYRGGDGSETIINSTATVTVTGTGTTADPILLESTGGTGDQIASEVPFPPPGYQSDNVQAAIEELQTDIDGLSGNVANPNDELIETFELNGTSLEITLAGVPRDLDPVFARMQMY